MVRLTAGRETWPIRGSFTISRGTKTAAEVISVELNDGGAVGRGESVPYAHYGESVEGVLDAIESLRGPIETGALDRLDLQDKLSAGAARNALDCAFWDLEAKRQGKRIWDLLGIPPLQPVTSVYTLSLDTPANMGQAAAENAHRPLLKLKLAGPDDLDRVSAVRKNAPKTKIVVDANEGWTADQYSDLAPALAGLGVVMIEQPLPAGNDGALAEIARPIPVCADESCHDRTSLPALAGRYDMVNIKLDKTGGLTEALALKEAARAAGYDIMIGCMLGTSLAMAPAVVLAQGAEVVDLDGPLLLARDRTDGLVFDDSVINPPSDALWG